MVAKSTFYTLLILCLAGCAIYRTEKITKIALLAPFEGQYREIGYDALYATQLALADSGISEVELLAIDDGGSIETATLRMQAIIQDPSIVAVIASGTYATSMEALQAIDNLPVIIPGHWNANPVHESIYILSSPEITSMISFEGELQTITDSQGEIIGSEMLSLRQVTSLLNDVSNIQIYSSASLPDADFRERYLNSAEFAPEPSLTASLSYDAMGLILHSIKTNAPINAIVYEGINGIFRFEDGYWLAAPINLFEYENSQLIAR